MQDRFGIHLNDQKRSLVVGRLSGFLRQRNIASFDEFIQLVNSDRSGDMLSSLIDRISTNLTFFNRESEHFDFFARRALPEIIARLKEGEQPRIWVAGCSSGEEAYMLAIYLLEANASTIEYEQSAILATDISSLALNKAQTGLYATENTAKLPKNIVSKYFEKVDDGHLRVRDSLRRLILFRRLNLMREEFPFKRQFHIIFCRNVMIYFDPPTRRRLVVQFASLLPAGGYLFVGHSESLGSTSPEFKFIQPAVYMRKDF